MSNTTGLVQDKRFLNQSMHKSLPSAMLATLGATINVFFDGILVGQKLGADGFTAVNLCMPIYLLICTLGSLIGYGGAIMSSYAIGNGDFKRSGKIYSIASALVFVVALFFTAAGIIFIDSITWLLAGNSPLYGDVQIYALITIAGTLPSMYIYIFLNYLRLDGKNLWVTISAIVLTSVNILLDIVFLFVLDLGIGGAAAAGVAGNLCSCIVSMIALSKSRNFKFSAKFSDINEVPHILKRGTPAALNNLMSSLRILCINYILLRVCGNSYVSIFSVLNNLSEFSLFFVSGIPLAAAPIVGVYSSEHSNDGLKILIKYQIKIHLIASILFGAIIIVFANHLSLLFGVEHEMYLPVTCLAASAILGGINSIMIYFYSNSRKTHLANILTVSRILIFSVVSLTLMLKANWFIWIFLPVTELLTMFFLGFILSILRFRSTRLSPILLLDYRWQRDGSIIDFSVDANPEAICEASEKISGFCSTNELSHKQSMRLGLAIEEILTLMTDECFENTQNKTFDLRAFHLDQSTGIRIRCLGKQFNPFAKNYDLPQDQSLGIELIQSIANNIEYQHILGANCIVLII